jgi:hypothetical protein
MRHPVQRLKSVSATLSLRTEAIFAASVSGMAIGRRPDCRRLIVEATTPFLCAVFSESDSEREHRACRAEERVIDRRRLDVDPEEVDWRDFSWAAGKLQL